MGKTLACRISGVAHDLPHRLDAHAFDHCSHVIGLRGELINLLKAERNATRRSPPAAQTLKLTDGESTCCPATGTGVACTFIRKTASL